jgi:hypothetical protein
MTEERWNECTNHHEHEWEEQVATLKAEVERLKAHTWQQERAAIVAWLNHVANHVGVDLHMTPDEFVDEISNFANLFEAGEHWAEGGTP